MKRIVIFLVMLYCNNIFAYACPADLKVNSDAQKVYDLLEKYKNIVEFKDCKIFINLCDKDKVSENQKILAEVLIKNKSGFSGYIPIMIFNKEFKPYRYEIEEYKHSFKYMLFDKLNEERDGPLQMWDLRFVYGEDQHNLEKIELGVYSANRQLNQPNGNDSRWYICK